MNKFLVAAIVCLMGVQSVGGMDQSTQTDLCTWCRQICDDEAACIAQEAVQRERDEQLILATNRRLIGATRNALRAGANVDVTLEGGRTPLHIAAWDCDGQLLRVLLEASADKNALDNWQRTPLYYAILKNGPGAVHTLVEAGADVDAVTPHGASLLHAAIDGLNDDERLVDFLLGYDFDAEIACQCYPTPLQHAAVYGECAVRRMRALLAGGAKMMPDSNS